MSINPEIPRAEEGTVGLTDMREFEIQFHDGGGGGNYNDGNDDDGRGGGDGDDNFESYPNPIGLWIFPFVGGLGVGAAAGVHNLETWGQYGSKKIVSVPGKSPRVEHDFTKKAEAIDAGMFVGPLLVGAAIGVAAGNMLENYINRKFKS